MNKGSLSNALTTTLLTNSMEMEHEQYKPKAMYVTRVSDIAECGKTHQGKGGHGWTGMCHILRVVGQPYLASRRVLGPIPKTSYFTRTAHTPCPQSKQISMASPQQVQFTQSLRCARFEHATHTHARWRWESTCNCCMWPHAHVLATYAHSHTRTLTLDSWTLATAGKVPRMGAAQHANNDASMQGVVGRYCCSAEEAWSKGRIFSTLR